MNEIKFKPIGIVHAEFTEPKGTPIQASATESRGKIEIFPEYAECLQDIEGFSHIHIIYCFHKLKNFKPLIKPFLDDKEHGIFATRSPARPNPIGLSVVRLIKKEINILYIQDVDILDGTPVLDIKPYIPEFDDRTVKKYGWVENKVHKMRETKDDGRFLDV